MWYLIDIYIQEFNHLSQYSQGSSECCKSVTIQATGAAERIRGGAGRFLGTYVATEEVYQGASVYHNVPQRGRLLSRYSDGTWRAGNMVGSAGTIKSVGTAECPASSSQWEYREVHGSTVGPWVPGDITVQCS